MTPATKTLILNALQQHKGDDHARWRLQLRALTPEALDREWGLSGKTPRQWAAEAEAHAVACDVAMEEVRQL